MLSSTKGGGLHHGNAALVACGQGMEGILRVERVAADMIPAMESKNNQTPAALISSYQNQSGFKPRHNNSGTKTKSAEHPNLH